MSSVRLKNPKTNLDSFGNVPSLTLHRKGKETIFTLPCPIYLTVGKHIKKNNGFGMNHIWEEHSQEIISSGYNSKNDVPKYVLKLLSSPSCLYFEDREIKATRINNVRLFTGTVILEYVRQIINKVEVPHWSVVTAYSQTRTSGNLVGSI